MKIAVYKKYLLMLGVVWTASLVLAVLAFIFVLSPRLQVAAQLADDVEKNRQKYDQAVAAAREENKKKLSDELEILKTKFMDYAVEAEDFANLSFDISRIAADKQISDVSVKTPEQAKTKEQLDSKNLQENRVDISFQSNYVQFASFLNALERHRPIVFIDMFKLSRGERNEPGVKVDMDLTIFVKKRSQG
jgi:Tfp pilus assembly protein PilO